MRGTRHDARRAGLTLVELVLVGSVLGLLALLMVETSSTMGRVTSTGNVQAVLQEQGEKALRAILVDLRRSGSVTVGGSLYPFVFDESVAAPPYAQNSHDPPQREAEEGDPDFGVLREIVFVLPSDRDRDGRPELDIDGDGVPELDGNRDGVYSDAPEDVDGFWDPALNTVHPETGVSWAEDEISYVVVTRADGRNWLERRVNGDPATARRIAHGVERVQFDTAWTAGFAIPLDAVRVRLFFRRRDDAGMLFRHEREVVLRLRNG